MGTRVFISYSHDTQVHKERVLEFANRLRKEGIESHIDQYNPHPHRGWPKWMEEQFAKADCIIVVASKKYLSGYNQDGRTGSGARFEGAILSAILLRNGVSFENIAIAVFGKADEAFIPDLLQGCSRYDLADESGYEALYRWLTKQPQVRVPSLGPLRTLPPVEISGTERGRFQLLCRALKPIFDENFRIFRDFGPNSGAASEGPVRHNLEAWFELRRSKVVPNNCRIRELVNAHRDVVPSDHRLVFDRLLSHIDAFEAHVTNDRVEYRRHQFPKEIVEIVEQNAS